MMNDCVFCKIAHRMIDTNYEYIGRNIVIVRDRDPKAKKHFIVIPYLHRLDLMDASRDLALSVLPVFDEMMSFIRMDFPNGFRTVINTGEDAGQTMQHFHIHLLGGEPLKGI